MKKLKGEKLVLGMGEKEVIVMYGKRLYRLSAFAEVDENHLKKDIDFIEDNYHTMFLKERD